MKTGIGKSQASLLVSIAKDVAFCVVLPASNVSIGRLGFEQLPFGVPGVMCVETAFIPLDDDASRIVVRPRRLGASGKGKAHPLPLAISEVLSLGSIGKLNDFREPLLVLIAIPLT